MNTQQSLITTVQTPKAMALQVTAFGKLQHNDYQNIGKALDSALKESPKSDINVCFDMTEMQGFSLRAIWDDLVLGIKHWSHFKKLPLLAINNGKKRPLISPAT